MIYNRKTNVNLCLHPSKATVQYIIFKTKCIFNYKCFLMVISNQSQTDILARADEPPADMSSFWGFLRTARK